MKGLPNPIEFALNLMLSEFDKNANIQQIATQFPTALIYEALNAAKANKKDIKKGSEGLLDLTIAAMERHLHINQTVIKCSLEGVDVLEGLQ